MSYELKWQNRQPDGEIKSMTDWSQMIVYCGEIKIYEWLRAVIQFYSRFDLVSHYPSIKSSMVLLSEAKNLEKHWWELVVLFREAL